MDTRSRRALEILIRDDARIEEGRYKFSEKQVGHILDLRPINLPGWNGGHQGEYVPAWTIKDLLTSSPRRAGS
jgi:hypothetical protein